jgi:hypothetical protein
MSTTQTYKNRTQEQDKAHALNIQLPHWNEPHNFLWSIELGGGCREPTWCSLLLTQDKIM